MRNKFLTKILGATLGLAMAIGVGVGVANYNNKAVKVTLLFETVKVPVAVLLLEFCVVLSK